jgi:hypothetical protein
LDHISEKKIIRKGLNEYYKKFWSKNVKGRVHFGDQGTEKRIISGWIIRK